MFFISRRRHTICALVTGVQTCALPILMVYLVSKCRTHLFPENAGDLLPDIALSGQLERRGVIVPGPDNSVQYLLFARDPPQLVTGHTGGNDNARVIVEHIVAMQMEIGRAHV